MRGTHMQNADPPLGVTSQRREKRPNPGDPAHGEGGGGVHGEDTQYLQIKPDL